MANLAMPLDGAMRFRMLAWLLAVSTSAAGAQSPDLPAALPVDSTLCEPCAISIKALTVLNTGDGPNSLRWYPANVRLDTHQRYWVLGAGSPRVFGPNGAPLQLRDGSAKLEFRAPTEALSVAGDSVVVIDAAEGHATVLDSALRGVRRLALAYPVTSGVGLKWPTHLVMNGHFPTPDAAGYPLHRVSFASGEVTMLDSFGPGDGVLLPGGALDMLPSMCADGTGGYWLAEVSRYRITRWTSNGTVVRALSRTTDWFPVSPKASLGGPKRPPTPMVTALQVDSTGLLWLAIRIPNREWQSAWAGAGTNTAEMAITSAMVRQLYSTVIEVIDPTSARLLGRMTTDEPVVALLPGIQAVLAAARPDGAMDLRVQHLTLSPRR